MIKITQKGDFATVTKYLNKNKKSFSNVNLDEYGRRGVEALSSATPIDTGMTASSWTYEIEHKDGQAVISFLNMNNNDGINIAIILQYGHATRTGGFVMGRDYINPAIRPIFDEMADKAWKEVTEV